MALYVDKGTPAHNLVLSGHLFNTNLTGAYLGSRDLVEERLGGLKLDILHKNGPLIRITGLSKILGSSKKTAIKNLLQKIIVVD